MPSHSHNHGHHHHAPSSHTVLTIAVILTLGYALVEFLAGLYSGSLALLGDAGHMVTDGFSLGLAAFAAWLATRSPSRQHSFGFGRVELLIAMINALFMIIVVVSISTAAVDRFLNPKPVIGEAVTLVAIIGLGINLFVAWILTRSDENLNVRGALLHVLGDLLGSVAALISGVVITMTGWMTIDPILSLIIVLLILFSSIRLLRESLHLLLDGVPFNIDLQAVGETLAELNDVKEVHDLHIWRLSAERTALSAHLIIDDLALWPSILIRTNKLLQNQFGIDHITLQPELRPVANRPLQIIEPDSSEI